MGICSKRPAPPHAGPDAPGGAIVVGRARWCGKTEVEDRGQGGGGPVARWFGIAGRGAFGVGVFTDSNFSAPAARFAVNESAYFGPTAVLRRCKSAEQCTAGGQRFR